MIQLLGYAAAATIMMTQLPQLYKTVRTHDVEGLSWRTYALMVLGASLYVPYAIAIHSIPVLVTNAWVAMEAGTILVYILRYGD